MGAIANAAPSDLTRPVVLIVDDHRMLVDALGIALSDRGFCCTAADLHSAESVVEQAARLSPDLVLLDLDLGTLDGLRLIRSLRATGLRVLVVTGCQDQQRLAGAVALGSIGWVSKARPFEAILDAAESACRDRPLLHEETRNRLTTTGRRYVENDALLRVRMAALTPRERDVLRGMVRGDTAEQMAHRYVISVGTVRTHIRSVLVKLGVSSQLAAAAVAVQWAATKRGFDGEELFAPLRSSA